MTTQSFGDLDEFDRAIRLQIYRHFAETCRAPTPVEVAAEIGHSPPAVEASYQRLATARAIVLAPSTINIWMAHPFSAVPTPYPVQTAHRSYWANCAWDALNLAALLGVDSHTIARCPDCAAALTLRVEGGALVPTEGLIHFAVPPRRFWENIGFT